MGSRPATTSPFLGPHPGSAQTRFLQGSVGLAGVVRFGSDPKAQGVVMVGGSGATTRDNDGYFVPISDQFQARGLHVLNYDKRGVGDSSGDWLSASMDDLADDACAARRHLAALTKLPVEQVGLFGHSEGGWVVLRAATREKESSPIPWIVTTSCPLTTPAVQERHGLQQAVLAHTHSIRQAERAGHLYDSLVHAGRVGASFGEADALVRAAQPPAPFIDYLWSAMDERLWKFTVAKLDHDPVPDAAGLRCPYLAVFGGADTTVPVAQSARQLAELASQPERSCLAQLSVDLWPGSDHRLRARLPGNLRLAVGSIADWISRRASSDIQGRSL